MANVIKHKRGSGSDPAANNLVLGELAIRTDTGKLFTKMDSGAIAEIAGGGSDIAINTLSSSSATGGGSATFNGSAYRFTLSAPPNVSAAQLLVSINGVIQKPVAGTGQPSEGFSVDGTDIILGDAPATGSDFFILTFKSLGVSEPADNSVTSAKIADGAIVNADINASAAILGTKIDAAFGSQDLTVGGTASVPTDGLQLSFSAPEGHIKSKNSSGAPASNLAFHTTDTSGNTNRVMHLRHDGNVGIGTSSPSELLQVAGTLECNNIKFLTVNKFETSANVLEGKGTNGARLRSALSSATTPSFSSSDDTDSGMFLPGSNVLGLTTGGTERLRIDSAGTLLVAHSSQRNNFNSAASTEHAPIIQLEGVNQNRALSITAASNNDGGILMLARQNGSVGSNTVVSSGNQIGRVDFQASGGTNMELAAQISAEVDGTPGDNDMPGRLLFKTTADGANSSTERMRIDSSGNIGIGTTSPLSGAKLTVASLGLAITGQNLAHSANSLRLGEEGSGLAQFRAYGPNTSTAGSFQFTTSKSNGLAGADNAMRIDSSGNIGIGTDNPNGESINGSQNLVIMDTTSDGGMNIKTGTSGNAQIHFSDTSANGQGRLVYAHATDTLRLYAGGNDQFAIQSGIIDIFENRHIYQRFTTAISDGGSRTFTITGLGYGWAKIQIGGYGEGHYLGVEITVAGLMAGGGTYYDNQSQMNVSSGSASVSFNENQTSFVVTLNNNVGNGGSIHCTAVFTGAGNSAHPNCAVS